MGADDDGVACLEGNERLIHDGGRRVCRRNQRRNNAHRHADFSQAALGDLTQHADGFHILDVLIGHFAAKQVFQHLVLPDAKAGFLDCHFGKPLRFFLTGLRDGLDYGVYALLRERRKFGLRGLCLGDKVPDLLNGLQILIKFQCVCLPSIALQALMRCRRASEESFPRPRGVWE